MSCIQKRVIRSFTPWFRNVSTASPAKKEGDISNAFQSLQGQLFKPLDMRFAEVKRRLISDNEDAIRASWERLLQRLREEIPLIVERGSRVIPEIDFSQLDQASDDFKTEHARRGVAIIRNVIPEAEALDLKSQLIDYITLNPSTKAFPPSNPQVYELYWAPSQLRARAHPSVLKASKFMMQFWNSKDPSARISLSHPISYGDRLRMRQPGDTKFALGPHVDGGSVERWEERGYGVGHVYDKIFSGEWEDYDPFEASCRLPVLSDLYQGSSACSVFRMYQGWLSMSDTGPFEGTLLVNPLLGLATSYYLLRPFFAPKREASSTYEDETYLHSSNWKLTQPPDSWIQGATPGQGLELVASLHPHLDLRKSMVHVPHVSPGDCVFWHCDTIHAVDNVHSGKTDSSVLYIPACPLTERNAAYLKRQRSAYVAGFPGPDFPGGTGESLHKGRLMADEMMRSLSDEGLRAFGLQPWDSLEQGLNAVETEVLDRANKILEFYD